MKTLMFTFLFVMSFTLGFAADKESKSEVKSDASQVTLTGKVVDKSTHEALVGVKVVLEGTDQVAYTDFDGNYNFKDISAGKYNVTASYISYQKASADNVQVTTENNQVDFSLNTTN